MGQASANGLIEAEGTSGDDVTGAQDQNWFVAIGPCDPCYLAMAGGDSALMAALQDRMAGDQDATLQDPDLVSESVHFDNTLSGRIGHAVKVAAVPA